jgi:hypothetical protein
MTAPRPTATTGATRATADPLPENASTGQLIGQLTEQISRLVRDEARLAQAEMTQKAKKLGVGAGLFGGAGLVAFFGVAALITAAILALALVLPGWLAALLVGVVLLAVAAALALVGKKDVQKGSPPVPTEAISSVKTDIATVKESAHR